MTARMAVTENRSGIGGHFVISGFRGPSTIAIGIASTKTELSSVCCGENVAGFATIPHREADEKAPAQKCIRQLLAVSATVPAEPGKIARNLALSHPFTEHAHGVVNLGTQSE